MADDESIPTDRANLPRTIVAGIDIPFVDLVILYIKLMFAAIPAAIIAAIIYAIVTAIMNS